MLYEKYIQLCERVPEEDREWFGRPISDRSPIWLSIDKDRCPALFLPAHAQDVRPEIALRAIAVSFSISCEIATKDGTFQTGCYTVIRLLDSDPDIVRLFTRICEDWFCSPSARMSNADIAHAIIEIAAIFMEISADQRNIIGLWGELFTILCASSIPGAVRCWTVGRTAKYDFVSADFVLDVKATLATVRKHRFSMEQLRPINSCQAYIASVSLAETQGGLTIGDLMEEIALQIADAGLRSVFTRQCLVKGGRDIYRSDLGLRPYPESNALAIYHAMDIPVPDIAAGAPIENVRFDVDLTTLPVLGDIEISQVLRFSPPDSVGV